MKKRRVNYLLTEKQVLKLESMRDETGLSVSEMIRRALDEWLYKGEEREIQKIPDKRTD